jgi:hypothetical protein
MKTKRYLPLSILTILLLVSLSPGPVHPQTPALVADNITLPAGLSAADWVQIRALLPVQQAYLKASNTGGWDDFGDSISISGDTVVVAASYEDSAATGVNGDQNDESASASGAVYIFVREGGIWSQQAYLKASNTGAQDHFGWAVAISGDTIVVGAIEEDSSATGVNGNQKDNSARNSGAAYVFVRSGGIWRQQAYLKASNTGARDRFGWSVAISGDTIVVGADQESSSATGVNGDQNDNQAIFSGAAYVFVRTGDVWRQQAYLKASNTDAEDNFGDEVAISKDTVVVGAWREDSNARGVNGNQSNNAARNSGAAYVFVRAGSAWSQQAYLKASNTGTKDLFSRSVAISGDTVAVGAPDEASAATGVNGNQKDNSAPWSGAAYVFVRANGVWSQQAYLKASNTDLADAFGYSVAISGDTVVVGAYRESSAATGVNGDQKDNSAEYSGAAYLFVRAGDAWSQHAYLKASNTEAWDSFGYSVAISGDTVVVGAVDEASAATGVDGDQSDNSAFLSGAAYAYSSRESLTLRLRSEAAQDGWILESGETTDIGSTMNTNANTFYLGDNAQNKQYRSVLSFSTKGLPDTAVITKITLSLKKQGITDGGNPIDLFQGIRVDIKNGFFGSAPGLQVSDFQAVADKTYGPAKPALTNGWYSINLTQAQFYINKLATNGGVTQFRLRFKLDDNNNAVANYLSLYSGNAPAASRPQLIVEYYVP